jgi:hypothetical protein
MAFLWKARRETPSVVLTERERAVVNSYIDAVRALNAQLDLEALLRAMRGAGGPEAVLGMTAFVQQLEGLVSAVRGEVGASAATAMRDSLPSGYKAVLRFDVADPRALAWAQERAGQLVREVSAGQRQMLRDTIAQGMRDQITVDELAVRIRSQIGLHQQWAQAVERATVKELARLRRTGMSESKALDKAEKFRERYHSKLVRTRARNIARTEIMTAANQGRFLAWTEMYNQGLVGPNDVKEWKPDTLACEVCRPLRGEQKPIFEPFSNGRMMPPAHPNCRCTATIRPVPIEKIKELLSYDDEDFTNADVKVADSKAIEPNVTAQLDGIAKSSGARLEGLRNRIKERNSLARKINSDKKAEGLSSKQAADKINDSLRYTMVVPHGEYTTTIEAVQQLFQSQNYTIKVKNFWQKGNDYKGVHFIVRDKSGRAFELQFHTDKSLEVKKEVHKIYENWRKMDARTPEARALFEKMVEISDRQPTPPNVGRIGRMLERG